MIAAIAVGAGNGYIYVRAEYPLAVDRLQKAIDQARDVGLLGENILGTEFSFDIRINRGAGAFVCGEGSALTASIEGNRGMPRTKPPAHRGKGSLGKAHRAQQCGNLCQHPLYHQRGRQRLPRHRQRNLPWHQGLCACGKHPPHRSHRGAYGHNAARDHFRYRRRHQGTERNSRPCRSAGRAAAVSRRSISISRWTTIRSSTSARSWLRRSRRHG